MHVGHVGVGEMPSEHPFHHAQVRGVGTAPCLATFASKHDENGALIVGVATIATNEAIIFHSSELARQTRRCRNDALGKVEHPEFAAGGLQHIEHLEPGQWHLAFFIERNGEGPIENCVGLAKQMQDSEALWVWTSHYEATCNGVTENQTSDKCELMRACYALREARLAVCSQSGRGFDGIGERQFVEQEPSTLHHGLGHCNTKRATQLSVRSVERKK